MSKNHLEENKSGSTIRVALITTLIGSLVGFLAIYVGFMPKDNGEQPKAAVALKKLDCPRPAKAGANELNRFNCGDMLSFVVSKPPAQMKKFSFKNGKGETVSLDDWRGKYVLLNIWATWCASCLKEMPDLDRLKADFSDRNFDVVAISIDRGGPDKPKRFLEKAGIKYLELFNDPQADLVGPLRILGMPTTFLIDPEGRHLGRLVGPAHWASEDAKRLIAQAMRQAG